MKCAPLLALLFVACQPPPPPGVRPGGGAGPGATPPPTAGTGGTEPAPPAPACHEGHEGHEGIEGSETTCRSSGEWKSLVFAICAANGEDLTFFEPGGGDCEGGTRYAKYGCCPPRPAPPPPPPGPNPPPAPPPPAACFGDSQGGDTSCKPPELWRRYATEACQARGATLSGIDFAVDCGGGSFRFTKYVCCP